MSWLIRLGKVPILVGSQIDWSGGANTALLLTGQGETINQRLGDAPNIIQINGVIEKAYAGSLRVECLRQEPVRLDGDPTDTPLIDVYPAGTIYVSPLRPIHSVASDMPDYRMISLPVAVWGDTTSHSRATVFHSIEEPNTFDMVGTCVVALPITATSVSDTVDGSRVTPDGTIFMVDNPTYGEVIKYTVASETSLELGNVSVSLSGNNIVMGNGLVRVSSNHDTASNKGRFTFDYYNGATWVAAGSFEFGVKASNGTLDYFSTQIPMVEPLFKGRDKERETLRVTYPSSSGGTYQIFSHITMERGKPFVWAQVHNASINTMSEARTRINLAGTTFRYFAGGGSVLDSQAGTYGAATIVGDTDTVNYAYVHDGTITATATAEVGFVRFKKTNHDHIINDAGSYFDSLTAVYDTLDMERGDPAPSIVLFAQKAGNTGITPDALAHEATRQVNSYQTVVRKTFVS